MQVKQFWPPTKHKLLYANLIVYGVTIVLLLVFRHELIWAQSAFRFYALSGPELPPSTDNLLLQEAAEYLKPNLIADFANTLADKFNTFYNALPVIKAEPQELSDARIALTDAVRIVLHNALDLIGVVAPKRM